jgi:AcrR family transcriptional regulator
VRLRRRLVRRSIQRTKSAIVGAALELIGTGSEVTMPAIAKAALVSEATAYRYFPDLVSLLREAMTGVWPDPAEAMLPVAASTDAVERIAFAAEYLLRGVLAYQGAVRAMIAATAVRPDDARLRPGERFGLIDVALRPLELTLAATDPAAFGQLKLDLAVVMGAEALFTLTDLCGLPPEVAIRSAIHTATAITAAALGQRSESASGPAA